MKSQILHVSGSKRTMSIEVGHALVNMLAGREIIRGAPFPPPIVENSHIIYYTGPINIGSIDHLSRSEIHRIIREYSYEIGNYGVYPNKRINFTHSDWDIFVDTRNPHITAAGWYEGRMSFPRNFPRLEYQQISIKSSEEPTVRRAFLHMNLAGFGFRADVYVFEQPRGNYISCGHVQSGFKYILFPLYASAEEIENQTHRILCVNCLSIEHEKRSEMALCILEGEPSEDAEALSPDTEYARTGYGTAGKYVILYLYTDGKYDRNLVDKVFISKI